MRVYGTCPLGGANSCPSGFSIRTWEISPLAVGIIGPRGHLWGRLTRPLWTGDQRQYNSEAWRRETWVCLPLLRGPRSILVHGPKLWRLVKAVSFCYTSEIDNTKLWIQMMLYRKLIWWCNMFGCVTYFHLLHTKKNLTVRYKNGYYLQYYFRSLQPEWRSKSAPAHASPAVKGTFYHKPCVGNNRPLDKPCMKNHS